MTRTNRRILSIFLGCAIAAGGVFGESVDELVSQLSGNDEIARSEARQLLAREGSEAVPKILPLIGHENESVWRAAFNTLLDVAHEVSVPGREAERGAVTENLMSLLSGDRSAAVKERALLLLPMIVPEGFDVDPIAKLLEDPDLRENARACLEEIGTPEARAVLCEALDSTDPEFVRALLNSLREVNLGKCAEQVHVLLKNEDPLTRVAAARALAIAGDPELNEEFWRVVERATPETRLETERAYLIYLEALGEKSPDLAGLYASAVQKFSFPTTRGAALIGLARHGGISSIDRIVETAAAHPTGELDDSVIAALEYLVSAEETGALTAVYPKFSPEIRRKSLHLFVRSGNPAFGMFLSNLFETEDPHVRFVLLQALGQSDFLTPLVRVVRLTAGEDRSRALSVLLSAAQRYESKGASNLAGEAFFRLHELSDTEEVRREALGGVARNPSVESLDILLEAIRSGVLGDATTPALVRLCRKMSESSDLEARRKALAEIRDRATTTEAVRELLKLSASIGPDENLPKSLGFVTDWSIVGPFAWDPQSGFTKANIGEPAIDLSAIYERQGSELRWKEYTTRDPLATVDLGTAIGILDKVCAYAFAEIEVGAGTEAEVRAGSDDGIKIWVNGAVVHENLVDRGSELDQDRAPVQLKRGKNAVLVQVTQGGGGWNFRLRFTRPDGNPLPFEKPNP